jgi:hypothetical protein
MDKKHNCLFMPMGVRVTSRKRLAVRLPRRAGLIERELDQDTHRQWQPRRCAVWSTLRENA